MHISAKRLEACGKPFIKQLLPKGKEGIVKDLCQLLPDSVPHVGTLLVVGRLWDPGISKIPSLPPLGACSHIKNGKKEDPGNYELVSLNRVPGKTGQHILLEAISKHIKDKKVTGNSQQGFTKGQVCLTNLVAFYNETTACVDSRRALDVVLINF
ncbi:rna-directed dna polymerase from mobile element jockey- hypothetical protein [Limosa lapponica baueri]|uniref:Rna-directed dna polymerase from mobile element jockey-like n=1 Tax=Limosa lapponica baueri TaxID=1758121 RepID=A0A2I0TTJ7_LIMLA|nr:rna-directed dna polymerase from mobile element jockey- hypothetical protein [Limosa lapponica baueri]